VRAVRQALGLSREEERVSATKPATTFTAMVYFLTLDGGQTVKIGTTTNPRIRFLALSKKATGAMTLLAAHPGSFKEERAAHRQFRHLSTGKNEYFQLTPELHSYLAEVRREWPDWENLEHSLNLRARS
jgi:hypothetical protein